MSHFVENLLCLHCHAINFSPQLSVKISSPCIFCALFFFHFGTSIWHVHLQMHLNIHPSIHPSIFYHLSSSKSLWHQANTNFNIQLQCSWAGTICRWVVLMANHQFVKNQATTSSPSANLQRTVFKTLLIFPDSTVSFLHEVRIMQRQILALRAVKKRVFFVILRTWQ